MQSFRTELENPIVEKDIIELEKKIRLFREGKIDEDKFRSLRLARGVYGQRQQGVQMVRIKLPYGKMTFEQWKRIADVSDKYSTGNLHLTTRQDVQIHFVSLDRTPELWAELERDEITLREACGNTVRNVTASVSAGVDKNELFDVSPYAHAIFKFFLRNPICQEMGRKIKIALSNNENDTALTYMHDLGFIPKIVDGKRGFKVVVGGGLGAQPKMADVAYQFLPEEKMIPFTEAALRVFDRHGERNSRNKARMKFLIQKIGFEQFMELVNQEQMALSTPIYPIDYNVSKPAQASKLANLDLEDQDLDYQLWFQTNVIEQKDPGLFGVYVRVPLGNISSTDSRSLINELEGYIGNDIRVTINQGLFFRNVPTQNLKYVYEVLKRHQLAAPGANSVANITACPGTDTCNLAIADSTNITKVLENVIDSEFPDLVKDSRLTIKISGCMNSCGQHGMANIGFHGSSLKSADKRVLPALQVLLGGGTMGDGIGRAAEKVIKVPSKKGPDVLRYIFSDYEKNGLPGEYFNDYYDRLGKIYFYELLKPLADLDQLTPTDFVDWGSDELFATAIGVGECAGVVVDLIGILLLESEEKLALAQETFDDHKYADAIYHAYSAQVNAGKALLLDNGIACNTQAKVIKDFSEQFSAQFNTDIESQILQINKQEPGESFALKYLEEANVLVKTAINIRSKALV